MDQTVSVLLESVYTAFWAILRRFFQFQCIGFAFVLLYIVHKLDQLF